MTPPKKNGEMTAARGCVWWVPHESRECGLSVAKAPVPARREVGWWGAPGTPAGGRQGRRGAWAAALS